ncbi:hypothetical protein [Sinorhizobium sp. CCBAU 05631]|uniref:hypothetical protein n=1 Tax=Sinorhizobium sp. CCBAU 05631 TaxID=794846 RepID=UPI0004AE5ACF|nr:hypothetical protein [Sinorhizobium sp. CCBAU 05631]ASY55439.1 hypothetical protein SS05631_c04840 [Sinorhizobium sp. CCBAU 05631]
MPKIPKNPDHERLYVKLFFGLFEGNATGPAVKYVVILAVLVIAGRASGLL